MLAALVATSVVALAASAGLIGTRDPGTHVTDMPEVSRTLVQQAIVEAPEWQHFQLLAYSRRADELQRLRELAATRAVIEYPERSEITADQEAPPAETSGADTHGGPAPESIAVASAPAAATAVEPEPDAPAVTGTTQATAQPPAQLEAPASPAAGPGGNTQVAAVVAGTNATESAKAPDQHKLVAKPWHGPRPHARKPGTVRIVAIPYRIPPQAMTGFPVDAPQPLAQTPAQQRAQARANDPAKVAAQTAAQMRAEEAATDARVNFGR